MSDATHNPNFAGFRVTAVDAITSMSHAHGATLAQLETERALVTEASRTIAELHKQVSELRSACQAVSESVPCHSDHCRHYGLAHGKPCDVEAIRLVRAALTHCT